MRRTADKVNMFKSSEILDFWSFLRSPVFRSPPHAASTNMLSQRLTVLYSEQRNQTTESHITNTCITTQ